MGGGGDRARSQRCSRAEVGSTCAWPKAARLSRLFCGKELGAQKLPTFKLARLLLETRGMGLLNT